MRAARRAQAEEREELQAVVAGLQKLLEIDRTALLMRALDEMPYEEIARALGISLAPVKVKIMSGYSEFRLCSPLAVLSAPHCIPIFHEPKDRPPVF